MNDRFQIPVNFMARDATRLFLRMLARHDIGTPEIWPLMLWHEWGSQQAISRPLRTGALVALPEPLTRDWCSQNETLALIELGAFWTGERGALVMAALASGFMQLVLNITDGSQCITLAEFGKYNPQFDPSHKTFQQIGNAVSIESKRAKKDPALAKKQRELIAQQGRLAFDATEAEVEAAIAFIMSLDRIGGKPPRPTKEYLPALIEGAVRVKRNFSAADTEDVAKWLLLMRVDASVAQGADLVIARFAEYLGRARP